MTFHKRSVSFLETNTLEKFDNRADNIRDYDKVVTRYRAKEDDLSFLSTSPKKISKPKFQKRVLIAIPNTVEFRNYKSNKLYRKTVVLQNVSTSLTRFQLAARPNYSRFTVTIESKGQTGGIPPGMHVKLIICFRSDVLDDPEETLTIKVQQGHPVFVTLRGCRDAPILRVMTNIPCSRYSQDKLRAKGTRSITEIPWESTESCGESINGSGNESGTSAEREYFRKVKKFDCGECPVGEQVTLSLMVQNIGGEGRFFIMSEIDWYSMHIEDITDNNTLVVPPFAMLPAYFTLKPHEYMYLYIHFFPKTLGMHTETLYLICDNCSVIPTEVIGDGVEHEQS